MNYPNDGGLKEPVRPFVNTVFDMLLQHFGAQISEPDSLRRDRFKITRLGRLYYRADNQNEVAGHIRLFGKHSGEGWTIYRYNEQAPGGAWALHRRWSFGLFCIHHVAPGKKATDPAGWHITWAKLKFAKASGGFTITWRPADTFSCRKGS